MAKGKGGGTIHALQKGLVSRSPDGAGDSSRKISSRASVNDGATRTGVAVGSDGNKKKDSGSLK